jgi:hypothetical protein
MLRHLAASIPAGILSLSLAAPLLAADGAAQTQPQPAMSFQEQVSRADTETLSRMLIERKAQRAAFSAQRAGDVSQLDEEMTQISTRLQSRLSQGNNDDTEVAPVVAFFPRIVQQPATPVTAAAPSVGTPAAAESAPTTAAPSRFDSQEDSGDAAARRRFEAPISVVLKDRTFQEALAAI